MRNILIPLFAIILSTAFSQKSDQKLTLSTTKKTEIMQTEENQKIRTLLDTYKKSLNTSDAKLAQSLYTENGIFMPTEAPSGIGAEGILKSYEFVFSQIQLNIEFYIDEIVVERDMAYAVTHSEGTVKIHANGMEVPEANRELFVFEKVNGEWKIARYMFNKTAPKG
ncbi:MAG: nuclear transport factor 2 family protein [Saprospiraceae bacterium]|nr:nuclear transport factor 2 family protein [Saprospiraceae bacterium]